MVILSPSNVIKRQFHCHQYFKLEVSGGIRETRERRLAVAENSAEIAEAGDVEDMFDARQ